MFCSSLLPKPLNNCLHCFTLKQGTVLIAIVQLFAASIAVIFCILALTHAVDIREMVARDAEDAMDRGIFEDDNSMRLNLKRMKIADCNAKGKVDELWYYLIFGTVHLSFIIFLLYGVLTNHRIFMAPWIYMNAIEFIILIDLLVTNKTILNISGCTSALIFGILAVISFYSIYVVCSAYMIMSKKNVLIHEIHGVKKKQIQTTSHCSTSSSRLATKPYDV